MPLNAVVKHFTLFTLLLSRLALNFGWRSQIVTCDKLIADLQSPVKNYPDAMIHIIRQPRLPRHYLSTFIPFFYHDPQPSQPIRNG